MKLINGRNKFAALAMAGMAVMALVGPEVALAAANDLNGMAQRGEQFIGNLKSLMISLFFLIGLCLFGFGLFSFYKESKEEGRGHAKRGAISVLVGVLLLIIPVAIKMTAATAVGSDANVESNIEATSGF